MTQAVLSTQLPRPSHRGKVRDIYDLGDALFIVTTDRISAFDVVLPNGVPGKGIVLNELSRFWFNRMANIVPNHFLAMGNDAPKVRKYLPNLPADIASRGMLVQKATPIKVECVVRGYLAGSAWAEYRKSGTIGGSLAPKGMRESDKLEKPTFTPTTKAAVGHDELISMEQMAGSVGAKLTQELERLSVAVYSAAHDYALTKGIIIADTKFEFGMVGDAITLIDEVLTPDSSRFWPAEKYQAGRGQDSLDKQYVRDWLEASGWNKEPPAPTLPEDVIQQTAHRYAEVYRQLTGEALPV
ncbi:MAG: Phosphoribosylaminoimidazole-succinocarboxamide synthase [Dehalococcoidia bacterium]|nr:Phosphoribosylaminoimidazole-succinocarboxamide synthase [Dehalococcoidia bacterium]